MTYREDMQAVFALDLPWDQLKGCSILVTGATGLIGGCLVEVLMSHPQGDYTVYASGRNEKRFQERFASFSHDCRLKFIRYDVSEPFDCDIRFDYIIHAASNASPNFFASKPVEIVKSNVLGVCHLMEYGISHGMKRFLYVSSGEVYGEGDGRPFTEDDSGYVNCATSRACYPSSKRTAETLCVSYAEEYGADIVIVRPCHVYGPHFTEADNRVYAQFIRNVMKGEDIIMKSTGSQFRSWCYVVDCVTGMLTCMLKGNRCGVYNIADPQSNISIKELADIVASAAGKKVICQAADPSESKGYNIVKRSTFSTDRIRALGWCPLTPITEGIVKTLMEVKAGSSPFASARSK